MRIEHPFKLQKQPLDLAPGLCLYGVLSLVWWLYLPGLSGGFLFDDFPNLAPLGAYGGIADWTSFKDFVLSGFSGPTGRPISLASFALDANTWPADPYPFKRTNLLIHLLTGCFVLWSSLKLLALLGTDSRKAAWIALISATLWLLHPLFVSTTLYVVQRMAQLSALFVLAGMTAFLHGRGLLENRRLAAYVFMTGGLGLGTLLAVLSKENGALLPVLVLVIEWVLRARPQVIKPHKLWHLVCVQLPALALLAYLALHIDLSPDLWPARNFDQPERLLTQARVMWDYLGALFMPHVEGNGLFQDGYVISRGWLSPPSTLFAALGLAMLFGLGVALRRRSPLVAVSILFFFAGHLLESSVIGLEIHFEHRNYLPAAFLFLPLAAAPFWRTHRIDARLLAAPLLAFLVLLTFTSHQRTQLWGDGEKLELFWALNAKNSPRAANTVAAHMLRQGRLDESITYLENITRQLPHSSLLLIRLLMHQEAAGLATPTHYQQTAEKLAHAQFDAQAIEAVREFTELVIEQLPQPDHRAALILLFDRLDAHERFGGFLQYQRYSAYARGRLALSFDNADSALAHFQTSASLFGDVDAALQMLSELAMSGSYSQALEMLEAANRIFATQSPKTLKRSADIYSHELQRLKSTLEDDLARSANPGSSAAQ